MIDDIESKIENLRLQEYSLKHRSFWKLVISPETYETGSNFKIVILKT